MTAVFCRAPSPLSYVSDAVRSGEVAGRSVAFGDPSRLSSTSSGGGVTNRSGGLALGGETPVEFEGIESRGFGSSDE